MSIPCAALMCHAPIVIPQIAGARAADCRHTTEAMQRTAARLVAHPADVLVIISPHTPRHRAAWGLCHEATLTGDMARFGRDDVRLALPGAPRAAAALERAARAAGLECLPVSGRQLDHGAFVPLHFLCGAGWRGPTLLIALPYPDTATEVAMGNAIARSARDLGQRWLVLASGDMSHRLQPDAPAGYHPRAHEFDGAFRSALASGDLRAACAIDPGLRELAAEDVVDSCATAAGAVGFDSAGSRVFAYEGPFGVGYLEAILYDDSPERGTGVDESAEPAGPPARLLAIARDAIAARLEGESPRVPALDPPWRESRGVFVTLRNPDGSLRGCIGHMEPAHGDLASEIASCAWSAATQDPRFEPVTRGELDTLRVELSLLQPPERVQGLDELDPRRYGVLVSRGRQRGVLLPDLPGVDLAEQQVAIARQKAGIAEGLAVELQRFEVRKLAEAE